MSIEHTPENTPEEPENTPESGENSDSAQESSEFGIVGKLEREPQMRAVIALAFELGGQHEDVSELLRMLSGKFVSAEQIRSRARYAHSSAQDYGRNLVDTSVTNDDKQWALNFVLPYLEIHRASTLWRHEPRGAAVAYHALAANVSTRVFSRVIASFYDNPDAYEALRGVVRRSIKQSGGAEKLMEELFVRAGEKRINDLKVVADTFIKESQRQKDQKLHHRAQWQHYPVVRHLIADLLEKNATARELRDTVQAAQPNAELKEGSVYRLIYRYKADPATVLERLRKGTDASEVSDQENNDLDLIDIGPATSGFVNAAFWKRDPRTGLIIARMIGLGATSVAIIETLDTHYPSHGMSRETIVAALDTAETRMECLNAIDKIAHWVSAGGDVREFVENRALELFQESKKK